MPMHDWTKVKAGVYHHFHNMWLGTIQHALNNGVLPPGYYALTEQRVAAVEADVLTLRGGSAPTPPGADPAVGLLERADKAVRPPRRRVVVADGSQEVVAVIEVVSPGNTKDRGNYAALVGKAADLLGTGVHFAFIDPFRPPAHHPGGLHAAVWKKATRPRRGKPPFTPPPGRPLVAASYCASAARVTAAVQPFAVGEPVPDLPLYLTADEAFVTLPLEATYAAAYPEVPRPFRDVLDG